MRSNNIIAKVSKNRILLKDSSKSYEIPQGNVKAGNNYAKCLYCGSVLPGKGREWYVRDAIKEWNSNYEKFLNGEITLEELRNSKARPTLLVKFKDEGRNLDFDEITEEDKKIFWKAFNKLREIDIVKISTEKAFPYGLLAFVRWGIDRFYKLFNARQLLILVKIVNRLNELRDKINGDEEYKNAILTYLTMAFLNHVRYNSMITSIDSTRAFNVPVTAFRGFAFSWTWVEISPLGNISGSLIKLLEHIKKGLKYLIYTNTNSQIEVPSYQDNLQKEPVD
ncbi:hypothetical protein [Sulfolobus sp. S-194]|uniref:hypothetical protein n=1 Tax=Sulfolobus sp. S-194 TaxID=2512240 RepID=UPI002570861E|nr:hypothetical protein [Sulfolobus sp. S-194]